MASVSVTSAFRSLSCASLLAAGAVSGWSAHHAASVSREAAAAAATGAVGSTQGMKLSDAMFPVNLALADEARTTIIQQMMADTGNLDAGNGEHVLKLMLELNQEMQTSLVIVTHDHSIANRMDRVLVLEDGRLVERA